MACDGAHGAICSHRLSRTNEQGERTHPSEDSCNGNTGKVRGSIAFLSCIRAALAAQHLMCTLHTQLTVRQASRATLSEFVQVCRYAH
jgi:hypothetical protein